MQYHMNQGNFTLCEPTCLLQGGWHWYKNLILISNVFIFNITSIVVNLKYFKISFWQFDNVKFPKSISSKDLYHHLSVWREFLEIDSNSTFSKKKKKKKNIPCGIYVLKKKKKKKNEYFKNVHFLILFFSQ